MAKCERVELNPTPPPVKYVLTMDKGEALAVFEALRTRGGRTAYDIADVFFKALWP